MKIIHSLSDMKTAIVKLKQSKASIGFVPTMGALHEGHRSLVKHARGENDQVVVSIFVNPLQFGPKEDFKSYPRTLQKDLALLKQEKVDIVFMPTAAEILFPANRRPSSMCRRFDRMPCVHRFRPRSFSRRGDDSRQIVPDCAAFARLLRPEGLSAVPRH